MRTRAPRKGKRCRSCGARNPKCRYFVRNGVGYASAQFGGGLRICKDEFHGIGGWAR